MAGASIIVRATDPTEKSVTLLVTALHQLMQLAVIEAKSLI